MFRQFLDAWNDLAMRHAMVVHFPIVLSLAGVPFVLAAAIARRVRSPLPRATTPASTISR